MRNSNRIDDESAASLFFSFNILDSIDISITVSMDISVVAVKRRKCCFKKSCRQFDYLVVDIFY